ncbi:MAG TPA: thymidine kinase [Mollicutes bacterium]|nr:thymidine kinase [Mollicutes bacterium]
MAKLYFTYGTMGSSKTAQALMTRFGLIERGQKVLFLKPEIDTRDGQNIIKSRIPGLEAPVEMFSNADDLLEKYNFDLLDIDCVIVDEVNFATKEHVEQLKYIAEEFDVPVFTFGLRANFKTELFEGSKRLFEIADTISEIKSPCHCGKKTIVNARYKGRKIIYDGESIVIGGNDQYKSLCYKCWREGKLDKK